MIGTTQAITYHFSVGRGPIIYPPIYIYPYGHHYGHHFGNYYGFYGHYGYYNRHAGMFHCMTCGKFHRYGYSCANPGRHGFNRGYYYNQRQNQYRHRQRKFKEYLGLENVLK